MSDSPEAYVSTGSNDAVSGPRSVAWRLLLAHERSFPAVASCRTLTIRSTTPPVAVNHDAHLGPDGDVRFDGRFRAPDVERTFRAPDGRAHFTVAELASALATALPATSWRRPPLLHVDRLDARHGFLAPVDGFLSRCRVRSGPHRPPASPWHSTWAPRTPPARPVALVADLGTAAYRQTTQTAGVLDVTWKLAVATSHSRHAPDDLRLLGKDAHLDLSDPAARSVADLLDDASYAAHTKRLFLDCIDTDAYDAECAAEAAQDAIDDHNARYAANEPIHTCQYAAAYAGTDSPFP